MELNTCTSNTATVLDQGGFLLQERLCVSRCCVRLGEGAKVSISRCDAETDDSQSYSCVSDRSSTRCDANYRIILSDLLFVVYIYIHSLAPLLGTPC